MALRKANALDCRDLVEQFTKFFIDNEMELISDEEIQEEFDDLTHPAKFSRIQIKAALVRAACQAAAHLAADYYESINKANPMAWADEGVSCVQENLNNVLDVIKQF